MENNKKDKSFEETKHVTYENHDLISAYFYSNQQHDFKQLMKQNFDVDVEIWHKKSCFSLQGTDKATKKAQAFLEQISKEAQAGADISRSYLREAVQNYKARTSGAPKNQTSAANDEGRSLVENFTKRTDKITAPHYKFEARNAEQQELFDAFDTKRLIFAHGEAGSGKTHVSVAKAVDYFERGIVKKIIIARPAVEAGEKLGFIPGNKDDKIAPYMQPVYDELDGILGKEQRQKLIAQGKIEAVPLAYLRGRTLSDAFVVIDEAQNCMPSQLEMVLTRAGEGTWIAVEGDMHQTDLDIDKSATGLAQGLHMFADKSFAKVMFLEECVRSELASSIVDTYKEFRDNAQDTLAKAHANDDKPSPAKTSQNSLKRPGA